MTIVMLSARSETKPTISEAVSSIMVENHLLYEALKLRIVNYHALAERVKKDVEEMTGRKVSVPSVVVAIKRFSDGLEGNGTEVAKILKDAKLSLVGRAADLTIESRGVPTIRILGDLLKLSPKFVGAPNILQLPSSVKVLADQEDADIIKQELSDRYTVTITGEAAKIMVRISQKAERVPGIAAFIAELLYRNGISMLDMFYGYEDLLLVVEERLGPKAYQVLASKISG